MSESLDMPFQWPLRNIDEARRMIIAVQDWAAAAGLDLRQPPEIPDSCCGRGCNGCVWEGYFAALRYWRDQAADRLGVNTGLSH